MARKASSAGKVKLSFARPEKQAAKAVRLCQQQGLLKSCGTRRDYESSLRVACGFVQEHRMGDLLHMSPQTAMLYLEAKSGVYSQKTLDQHRQAIQCFLHARGELKRDETLPVVRSQRETVLGSRFYTEEQMRMVANAQAGRYSLATRIAYASGLRAHELYTIHREGEGRPADTRYYANGEPKALPGKFEGMGPGEKYLVVGKGGLCREVFLPATLAAELEERRLPEPRSVTDRGIHYNEVRYDIAGGQAWSTNFSKTSNEVLGWSRGGHGLRHSYAQNRMEALQQKYSWEYSREAVSQEMGHFRPDITSAYLR